MMGGSVDRRIGGSGRGMCGGWLRIGGGLGGDGGGGGGGGGGGSGGSPRGCGCDSGKRLGDVEGGESC